MTKKQSKLRVTYPVSNNLESKMATKLSKVELLRIELYRIDDNVNVNLETKYGCMIWPFSSLCVLRFSRSTFDESGCTSPRFAPTFRVFHKYGVTMFLLFQS